MRPLERNEFNTLSPGAALPTLPVVPQTLIQRLRAEWSIPLFSLRDASGKIIDMKASFSSSPKWISATVRLATLLWCLQILHLDLYIVKAKYYYAFLSQWVHSMSILYLILATYVGLVDSATAPRDRDPRRAAPFLVRLLWGMFTAVMVSQWIVTVVFWVHYDVFLKMPKITRVSSVVKHGGFLAIMLWDGLYWSRIPVRVKHFFFALHFFHLYTVWTIIHNFTDSLTNPLFHGTDPNLADDDAIYPHFSFKRHLAYSMWLVVSATFLIIPAAFLVVWGMAAWSWGHGGFGWAHRRYVRGDDTYYVVQESEEVARATDCEKVNGPEWRYGSAKLL